ncbi:MAG: LacI family DNA-binding transcriptional regulator [Clostridia bacterium]|nr:LacI family DNA-binding transcriptional regulator [Clostridia bacterium]
MKNVTMRDIGARLGVSTVTISKALGGKDGVSDAVREKIIETAKQMGYHYASSSTETNNGVVIGILTPDRSFSAPSFYSDMYRSLLRELTDAGMLGVLEIVSEQDELELNMPAVMTIQRANGFVLMGQFSEDYVQAMLDTGYPMVLLDFSFDGPDVDAVVSDGQSGTFQLTRYLIDHGHKEIGFVGNIHRTSSIMDRYSGYLRAMALSALAVRPEYVIPDMMDKVNYLTEYSLPDPLPTALVCNNDILALNISKILEKRGLRIPEDISVVGFDDYLGTQKSNPFTTYAVDRQHMAQVTVRRLQGRMRDGMEGPLRTSVGGWLVERSSVMDLNTGKVCGKEYENTDE